MIIIDYSQIAIANIIGGIEGELDENGIRHMVLNSIRGYLKRYKKEYGKKVILACDGSSCWRKEVFPYYKANRRKTQANSKYNWEFIYTTMATIRDELKEWSPFYVLHFDDCEGDDVIYQMANDTSEKCLIISSDKDFVYLHHKPNIKQLSPITKKMVTYKDPVRTGLELIIRGDSADGVPNILSQDDTFVIGKRQRPLRKELVAKWVDLHPDQFCDETTIQYYKRNKTLIDLKSIPALVRVKVLHGYESMTPASASKFVKYLMMKKATLLINEIGDFF